MHSPASCATPFAAFAVIVAATLPAQSALLVAVGAWSVNQGIGFGLLHYLVDASTILWGLVIGGAALAATTASMAVLRLTQWTGNTVALSAALIGAYATYELVIFAATPFLGGAGNFSTAIVGRLGLLRVLWLIGLEEHSPARSRRSALVPRTISSMTPRMSACPQLRLACNLWL